MKIRYFLALGLVLIFTSCKREFLEIKPDKALLVPTTFADFRALLDNPDIMNFQASGLTMLAADEYFLEDATWNGLSSAPERNSYIWRSDLAQGEDIYDWNFPYKSIFYANVVLDGLEKMSETEKSDPQWNKIKGAALLFRGLGLFYLAQTFCMQYDQKSGLNPGIPVPLTSDVNLKHDRGTLKKTYQQIIADLQIAFDLLPKNEISKTRPTRQSASLLMARTYLTMQKFDEAKGWANKCISESKPLIDYNTLDTTSYNSFEETLPNGNDEVLLFIGFVSYGFEGGATTLITPELYSLYEDNDLRRPIFFYKRGEGIFNNKNYGGLSSPEAYLIAAESYARANELTDALRLLNQLLERRIKKDEFIPVSVTDKEYLLELILNERRKELACRGLRWYDLKRLNLETKFAKTLTRTVANETYELLPNDQRYVYPIPDSEISRNRLAQNPR